jgi:thioredoxin 1
MNDMFSTINRYSNVLIGAAVIAVCLFLLRPGKLREIEPSTDAQFQAAVAQESRPVLVKFGATWCGPCVATDKALAEFESSSNGDVKVVIFDVDSNPSISQHYGVSSIPHTFLFWQGKIVDERVGGMDSREIQAWIKANERKWHN